MFSASRKPFSSTRHHCSAALLGLIGVLITHRVEAKTEAIHLRFAGAAGCDSSDTFIEKVERRTKHIVWTSEVDAARHFDVQIEKAEPEYRGTLTITAGDQAAATREVVGSCENVVTALSFFAALAVDPRAAETRPTESTDKAEPDLKITADDSDPGEDSSTSEAPTKADGEENEQSNNNQKSVPKSATKATDKDEVKDAEPPTQAGEASKPTPEERPAPTPSLPSKQPSWRWSIGAHAGAHSGLGDSLRLTIPVFAEVMFDGETLWSPSFRAGIVTVPQITIPFEGGEARLQRFSGGLSACPLRWQFTSTLALVPCLGFEAGAILSESDGLDGSAPGTAPWASTQVIGRLAFQPSPWFALELQGEFAVALVQPSFRIQPDTSPLLSTDPVFGGFGGGAKVFFP